MANTVIWQNPSDANDKIEYNDDDTNAEYYRFRIDTGFEFTVKRDATNTRTLVTVSGSTWPGVIELNANGEIWAKGDLKIKIDSDGGGTNKLIIQGSAGANVAEIDELGNVSIDGDYKYRSAKTRTLVLSQMAIAEVDSGAGDAACHWITHANLKPLLISKGPSDIATAFLPLYLPQGAVVTNFAINYQETIQAGGETRTMGCYIYQLPEFGTTNSSVQYGANVIGTMAGGTTNGTQSVTVTGLTIDNTKYAYYIYVAFNNSDPNNGGLEGIGVSKFKITYTLSALGL